MEPKTKFDYSKLLRKYFNESKSGSRAGSAGLVVCGEFEEAERIGDRIAVVVDDHCIAVGTAGQLRRGCVQSYTVETVLVSAGDKNRLKALIRAQFAFFEFNNDDSNESRIIFDISENEAHPLSRLVRFLQSLKTEERIISDYTINPFSLEQHYLKIARRALQEDPAKRNRELFFQKYLPNPPEPKPYTPLPTSDTSGSEF